MTGQELEETLKAIKDTARQVKASGKLLKDGDRREAISALMTARGYVETILKALQS